MFFGYGPDFHDIHNIVSMREQVPEIDDALYVRHPFRQIGIASAETFQRLPNLLEIAFDRILGHRVAAPCLDIHASGISPDAVAGADDVFKES